LVFVIVILAGMFLMPIQFHTCKIGDFSGGDERDTNLPDLIKEKLYFDVLKRAERRKNDRRNNERRRMRDPIFDDTGV
jgi:hypothetical protein